VTEDKSNYLTHDGNEVVPGGDASNMKRQSGVEVGSDSRHYDTAASEDTRGENGNWNINLLLDVELPVRVSFGQTEMQLRDVFNLGAGSVIELDKLVNDPVSVIVNNKPIAKGEVVMVDGNYGVRILEVESTADRIRSLG
jgi:flagellar motor switch protein FliN